MITGNRKLDLERSFNRVMERERERRELEKCYPNYGSRKGSRRHSQNEELILEEFSIKNEKEQTVTENEDLNNNLIKNKFKTISNQTLVIIPHHRASEPHLFKKLLVACCESCERRASLTLLVSNSYHQHNYERKKNFSQSEECFNRSCSDCEIEREDDEDEDIPFECDEENKAEVHDTLANMYFNKVVLPDMDYVEDFVDFLIDAELNDLPVLKRACERYLCGELNTKKELMTSLILDLFFIAMVFRLPVMKSMTLTELCDRYYEMEDVGILMERDEYKSLDKRIRQLCGDRNLADLVDECKRFREQCLRVQRVNFCSKQTNDK
uniref:BTB domain-containing protein n=1 Tax=Meloidogyne hapla TaxID=6305 RepID=A0A1I8C3B1_MELHA